MQVDMYSWNLALWNWGTVITKESWRKNNRPWGLKLQKWDGLLYYKI